MREKDKQWLLKEKYQNIKTDDFFIDCKKIDEGEPLGYVIGFVNFLDCVIYLDSKPLIPRFETEFWTEKIINKIKELSKKKLDILDLCAGSGCIGIAILKSSLNTKVDFGEIEKKHLDTIIKNLSLNEIHNQRYKVIQSDLFSKIENKYDIIVSNPPYIDPDLDRTEISVKNFEPHEALYGGKKGFEIINKIIKSAPDHLKKQGQLWIEHEPEQSDIIKDLGQKNGFEVSTQLDQYQHQRYSILVLQ